MNRPVLTDHYCYTPPHDHGFLSDSTTAVILFLAFVGVALAVTLLMVLNDYERLRKEKRFLEEALEDDDTEFV